MTLEILSTDQFIERVKYEVGASFHSAKVFAKADGRTTHMDLTLRQSVYRNRNYWDRVELESRIVELTKGLPRAKYALRFDDDTIRVASVDFHVPFTFQIHIENDQVGRPDEMPPSASLPPLPSSPAAPLILLLSSQFRIVNDSGSKYDDRYSLSSRFFPYLAEDPIWHRARKANVELPDFKNSVSVLRFLKGLPLKLYIMDAEKIRLKSWQIALGIAGVLDDYRLVELKRAEANSNRLEPSEEGINTSTITSESTIRTEKIGLMSSFLDETTRSLMLECIHGLRTFSSIGLGHGGVSWDLETLACLKKLRAMALGVHTAQQLLDGNPALLFKYAIDEGEKLVKIADWPI